MHACSLHKALAIVEGDLANYRRLAAYHYRDSCPVAVKAVFTLRPKRPSPALGGKPAGAIVYAMATPRVELRRVATAGLFADFDRQTELSLINRNIRSIARVVIEPRFRGIGLATRLVRETMPRMNVPIIEALGVMPKVNPFLERAGMRPLAGSDALHRPLHHVELIEALSTVGIEEDRLIDPESVQAVLDALTWPAADFIETRIQRFLKSHGRRRSMAPGLERTRYLLGKLTGRPAYYIWFNPKLEVTLP
jgi:GNAT superfamily N-acetyltransferase